MRDGGGGGEGNKENYNVLQQAKENLIAERNEKGRALEEVQMEVRRLGDEVVERREEEERQRGETERLEREMTMLESEVEHKEEVNVALANKIKV